MKKIIFSFCTVGIIFLLCFNGCDNGSTKVNTGVSLVCLGDSLTAGYGATTPGSDDKTKSYPAYLQKKLNIPVINAGITGDTTLQALSRINTDVLMKNPQIVIIELGANDLFKNIPCKTTKDNLQEIINLINDGNRKIYIAKFYTEEVARSFARSFAKSMTDNFGITDYAISAMLITLIEQYDDMFETLASENKVELIDDIWDGIWDVYMSDSVHPNAKGYELMADNYYKAMKPYLEANNLLK
jgi:acyl-CoA thioesterase-1